MTKPKRGKENDEQAELREACTKVALESASRSQLVANLRVGQAGEWYRTQEQKSSGNSEEYVAVCELAAPERSVLSQRGSSRSCWLGVPVRALFRAARCIQSAPQAALLFLPNPACHRDPRVQPTTRASRPCQCDEGEGPGQARRTNTKDALPSDQPLPCPKCVTIPLLRLQRAGLCPGLGPQGEGREGAHGRPAAAAAQARQR